MDMRFTIPRVALGIFLLTSAVTGGQQKDGVTYGGMSLVRQPADVTGQYFVVFKSTPGSAERTLITGSRATILYQYSIIPAFAVRVPDAASLNTIQSDARVSYVRPFQGSY